ncbi:MAG: hypothetical protein Fur0034_06320 [Desulfuromonadia bacterium]
MIVQKRHRTAVTLAGMLLSLLLLGTPFAMTIPEPVSFRNAPTARPERDGVPLVYTPRPVLYAAASGDRKTLATVEKGDQGNELWIYRIDRVTLPSLIYRSTAPLGPLSLDREGRLVAFVDGTMDVKGDIAIIPTSPGGTPRRLTGSDSGDDAPAFAPDGSILYQKEIPGSGVRSIIRLDPSTGTERRLPITIDAGFPAPFPDGSRVVFVSRDPSGRGDLWLYDEREGVRRLTATPDQELHPVCVDSRTVILTRIPPGGGNPRIVRVSLDDGENPFRRDFPLTSGREGAIAPIPLADGFAFIQSGGGGGVLLRLPPDGELPLLQTAADALERGRRIASRRPFDPALTDLAYASLLAIDSPPTLTGGMGGVERLLTLLEGGGGDPAPLLTLLATRYQGVEDVRRIVEIIRARLDAGSPSEDPAALRRGVVERIQSLMNGGGPKVIQRGKIEQGRVLLAGSAADMEQGVALLDGAARGDDPSLRGEATILAAGGMIRLGLTAEGVERLIRLALDPSIPEPLGDRGIDLLLDTVSGGGREISPLAELAERYREKSPRIAAWCWNRIGDIHIRQNERAKGKDAYRTVIGQIPPAGSATAAARFALAELLYQEGRYAEAKGLYETELAGRPEESSIYLLARRAYLKKSWGGGELLFRQGEVAAARSLFYDLLRYDGRYLEAHRGFIKAVAAMGETAELVAAYRESLSRHPDDPVILYATGLALTYLPGKEALEEADRLIQRAAERMPESEYPPQTRGYIAEVLETVHGEQGGLERSIELYRRALLLNRPDVNPENRANLELNVGNIAYLLGSTATAWRHYQNRLASNVPFDDTDTELLFYRRYAESAFLVGERNAPIQGYTKGLGLVEKRIDPGRPLDLMGKLSRRVVERLFPSAVRDQTLVDRQERISTTLSRIGKDLPAKLPDPRWERIAQTLSDLLREERSIILEFRKENREGYERFRGELEGVAMAVERSLGEIPRLLETKAELLDRLGLALLEGERFREAAERFDEAFSANQGIGRFENLAANRRSASLARFRQAASESGESRRKLLAQSEKGFREVLSLLETYPPATKKPEGRKGGLISISLTLSLDKKGGTEAAYGFTPEQERRLAETFLARIAAEEGRISEAREIFDRLAKRYPEEVSRVSPGDLFGVSLLEHRRGHLALSLDDPAGAFHRFIRSAVTAVEQGNVTGAMTGIVDAGLLLPRLDAASRDRFGRVLAEIDRLVLPLRETIPFPRVNRYLAETGAIILAAAAGDDPLSRDAAVARGVERLLRGRFSLEREGNLSNPEVQILAGAIRLNLAAATALPDERERLLSPLLPGSGSPLFHPPFAWRSLALLGRYDEALSLLATLPPLFFDARPGELFSRFAPWIVEISRVNPEKGFALVERLSEEDRLHQTVPPLLGINDAAILPLLREVEPHLREIQSHEGENTPDKREYALLRVTQEREILDRLLGRERERLPAIYRIMGDRLIFLAVDAAGAERRRVTELCRKGELDPLCSLFTPRPAEAVDLLELFLDRSIVRFLPLPDGEWLLFHLGGEKGVVSRVVTFDELSRLVTTPGTIAIGEEIGRVAPTGRIHGGVSGSQLVRAMENRRPFRSRVLDPASRFPDTPGFSIQRQREWGDRLPFAHTLLLPGRGGLLYTPPSREGESGAVRPLVEGGDGVRLDLLSLAAPRNLSLVVLSPPDPREITPFVHMTTAMGIPSILITAGTLPTRFAELYRERSLADAAEGLPSPFLLLGDPGPDRTEAEKLAKSRFNSQVKGGVSLFNKGRWSEALSLFLDAETTAETVKELAPYRAPLAKQIREAAYRAGDTPKAVEAARRLVSLLTREKPYSPDHADALLKLGILLGRVEQYGEAEKVLSEAVSLYRDLGMQREAGETLAEFAVVMENGVNYEAAGTLFQESAKEGKGDTRHLADQYRNLGRLNDLRLSRYPRAIEYYREANRLYRGLKDPLLVAETLLEEGRCRRLLGEFTAAEALYAEALSLVGDKDPRLAGRIRLEQGNNRWFQGNYQEAFDIREEVEKRAREKGWDLDLVMAKNTGGLIWWTLGDTRRALTELDAALQIARRIEGRRDEVATTLNNRGLVLRESRRYAEALATLEEALSIDRSLKSKWGIAYDLRNIALTHLKRGAPRDALPLLEEARTIAAETGDGVNIAKIELARGDTLLQLDDREKAADAYEAAISHGRRMGLKEVIWRGLLGKGRIQRLAGRMADAEGSLREGIAIVEEMRSAIRLDQLKDGFLADKIDLYREAVSLLVDQGRVREAFSVAERSRARSLIDILGRQRLSLSGVVSQELFDRQRRLKEQMEEQETLLIQAPPDRKEIFAKGLETLRAAYQDLLIEMERKRPDLLSLVRVEPFTVDRLQPLLEPGVVILSYYQLADRLLCWRLGRDRFDLVTIPVSEGELSDLIGRYRRMLQNLEPFEQVSMRLHELVASQPIKGIPDGTTLGIVPHGSLHYLSFATLFDGDRFLIDRHPLFHLPAASVLSHTLSRRTVVKNRKVLAIGNPDLGDPSLDLPFAEREAATLRWRYQEVTVLTRERATESWVRENISTFGVIHLASHGEFDSINPLFSSVRLARDQNNDGRLQADEVFGLDIRADLVVLSACQTGLGEITRGDDVVGMNRAFLFAGTHALLSSLWRVSDVSTAIMMKQFYREYAEREKGGALRSAMLQVRNRYPHPGYWGAFILTGDYR